LLKVQAFAHVISYIVYDLFGCGCSMGSCGKFDNKLGKAILRNKIRPPELARCLPILPFFITDNLSKLISH